jgi:hypothetical protein
MRSLRPEQILLLLLFVMVPLLNLLVRWLQRRAREQQQRPVPVEPRAAEPVRREGRPPAPLPPRARLIEPALPREGPRETLPAPRPQPVLRRPRPLGGRAAIRRAIVAMTILGPCRGVEEPWPRQTVRPPRSA